MREQYMGGEGVGRSMGRGVGEQYMGGEGVGRSMGRSVGEEYMGGEGVRKSMGGGDGVGEENVGGDGVGNNGRSEGGGAYMGERVGVEDVHTVDNRGTEKDDVTECTPGKGDEWQVGRSASCIERRRKSSNCLSCKR